MAIERVEANDTSPSSLEGAEGRERQDAVMFSAGYEALETQQGSGNAGRVQAILREHGDDAGLCNELQQMLDSPEFQYLLPGAQGQMLDALGDHPTADAARRLRFLAAEPEVPGWDDIRETAAGSVPVSPSSTSRTGGSRGRPEWEYDLNPVSAAGNTVHAAEITAEIAAKITGSMAAHGIGLAASGLGAILLGAECIEQVMEGRRLGIEEGKRIAQADGYVDAMQELIARGAEHFDPSSAPSYLPHQVGRQAWTDGASRALRAWNQLEPAQRAQLRAMDGAQQAAFMSALRDMTDERTGQPSRRVD